MVLDNPFSALDSKTSHKVFSNLFAKDTGLLRKRGVTIILATQTGMNLLQECCLWKSC